MVTKKNKEKKVVQLHADSKKLIKKTLADSLTCYKEYFRLIISIIISNKSKVKSLNIKSTFHQNQTVNRSVFLRPRKKAGTKKLWKLLITVYGLCDVSRAWYLKMKEVLQNVSVCKSKFDDSICMQMVN